MLVCLCWRQIDSVDFWWQYRTGRLIGESGIPRRDVFTYPSHGQPWIELRWLFCAAEAWIVDHLGFVALNLVKTLAVSGAFLLSLLAGKGLKRTVVAAPILGLAILSSSSRFVVRPEIVSMLLLAAFLFVLDRWRRDGTRWIAGLPLLQILWTNSHSLFWLGPFSVLLMLVEGVAVRRESTVLVWVLLGTLGACLVNPYGLEGALFPLTLIRESQSAVYRNAISELKSPFEFAGLLSTQAFFVLLGLSTLSIPAAWKKLDPFWTLTATMAAALALLSNRNLALFALVSVPFNLHNWSYLKNMSKMLELGAPIVSMGAAVWLMWFVVGNGLSLRNSNHRYFGAGIAPNAYPVGCAAFLRERGFSGRMFNTLG